MKVSDNGVSSYISARVNAILECNGELNIHVTPLRLQKLLYIDYGRYLTRNGEILSDFAFQAWKYGPVLPPVYNHYKGKKTIKRKLPSDDGVYYTLVAQEKENVRDTVKMHALFSDNELTELTHVKEGGWDKVYKEETGDEPIKLNDIIEEFSVYRR